MNCGWLFCRRNFRQKAKKTLILSTSDIQSASKTRCSIAWHRFVLHDTTVPNSTKLSTTNSTMSSRHFDKISREVTAQSCLRAQSHSQCLQNPADTEESLHGPKGCNVSQRCRYLCRCHVVCLSVFLSLFCFVFWGGFFPLRRRLGVGGGGGGLFQDLCRRDVVSASYRCRKYGFPPYLDLTYVSRWCRCSFRCRVGVVSCCFELESKIFKSAIFCRLRPVVLESEIQISS